MLFVLPRLQISVNWGEDANNVCLNCKTTQVQWFPTSGYRLKCTKTVDSVLNCSKVWDCGKTQQTVEGYSLSCTKNSSTVDSWVLSCPKSLSTVDSYSLVCSKGNSAVAEVEVYKEYTPGSYILRVSIRQFHQDVSVVSYSWSTGSTASSIEVTGNGEYSCTVQVSDGGVSRTAVVSYTVSDYDSEPPMVTGVSKTSSRVCGHDSIEVSASDNRGVFDYMLSK